MANASVHGTESTNKPSMHMARSSFPPQGHIADLNPPLERPGRFSIDTFMGWILCTLGASLAFGLEFALGFATPADCAAASAPAFFRGAAFFFFMAGPLTTEQTHKNYVSIARKSRHRQSGQHSSSPKDCLQVQVAGP
jgi:hypothetical protein